MPVPRRRGSAVHSVDGLPSTPAARSRHCQCWPARSTCRPWPRSASKMVPLQVAADPRRAETGAGPDLGARRSKATGRRRSLHLRRDGTELPYHVRARIVANPDTTTTCACPAAPAYEAGIDLWRRRSTQPPWPLRAWPQIRLHDLWSTGATPGGAGHAPRHDRRTWTAERSSNWWMTRQRVRQCSAACSAGNGVPTPAALARVTVSLQPTVRRPPAAARTCSRGGTGSCAHSPRQAAQAAAGRGGRR